MRSDRLYLVDIIEAADAIAAFISGVDAEHFPNNDLVRSAVLHKLTVIGEATARISMPLRARFPETPWADIVGFRNIAVHAYFSVDFHGCGFSPRFSRASGGRGTNHRLQASRPSGGGSIRRKAFQAGVYPPPAQPTGFSR